MKRLTSITLLLLVLLMAYTSIASAASVKSAPQLSGVLPGITEGSAYAATLTVPAGSTVTKIGPLFPVALGCNTVTKTETSSAASLTLGSFASSGSLLDQVSSTRTSTTANVHSSATLQNVTILSGIITATAVNASVSSTATATAATSTNTTSFTHLSVAGISITDTPAPNTTISLPGLGKVVLNEQIGPKNGTKATTITVNAIDVEVTLTNVFGLPVGAHIIIGHVKSSFTGTKSAAIVGADAYGLRAFAKAGVVFVESGPWAEASIGCTGGNKTVSVTSVMVPGIGSTGIITDTASGQITSSGSHAQGSSAVAHLTLLSGLITADTITTTAQATNSSGSLSTSGSTSLVNAFLAGTPLPVNPPANTKINIANLGYVILNKQSLSATAIKATAKVNAIELHVTTSNIFGLPVGVQIVVAHSEASTALY